MDGTLSACGGVHARVRLAGWRAVLTGRTRMPASPFTLLGRKCMGHTACLWVYSHSLTSTRGQGDALSC